jgi:hypothetical protein
VTNLEIRHAFVIDFCGKQQFRRIVPKAGVIRKFDDSETFIEKLKGGLLTFALGNMPHDKYRLALPLGP